MYNDMKEGNGVNNMLDDTDKLGLWKNLKFNRHISYYVTSYNEFFNDVYSNAMLQLHEFFAILKYSR